MTSVTEKINPEKSKQLRPLRITLAVLVVILVILILESLPTSVSDRPSSVETEVDVQVPLSEARYFLFNTFIDRVEDQAELKMQEMGVPKEEYENIGEYFTKDELLKMECQLTLAARLTENYVEVDDASVSELKKIYDLPQSYSLERFARLKDAPDEYKVLSDLVSEYHYCLEPDED